MSLPEALADYGEKLTEGGRFRFYVRVTPNARRDAIEGWKALADGTVALHVRLNAQPEDGKANKALLAFLAKEWGVSKSALTLQKGESSRLKRLVIDL